jgi:arylsulfatase A-like enzyme
VASLTGGKVSEEIELDGIDFSPVLFKRKSMEERVAYWRYKGEKAVRRGPWKLLVLKDSTYLFNLAADPSEETNLVEQHSDVSESLLRLLQTWEDEMNRYQQNAY